jgi:transcriptional regulator with XRE-family HTH domain
MPRLVANGPAIRVLRQTKGWKAVTFAEAIGISAGYLNNIEAGRKQGSPPVLRRIADVLEVPFKAISMPHQQPMSAEVAAVL